MLVDKGMDLELFKCLEEIFGRVVLEVHWLVIGGLEI